LPAFTCLFWRGSTVKFCGEILWGPSFDTDAEVAHNLGSLLLSFVLFSGLAALLTPVVLVFLNGLRR